MNTTAFPPHPTFQLSAWVYVHPVMLPHLSDPADRFLPFSNYLLHFLCFLIYSFPSFPINPLLSFHAAYRQLQLQLVWISLCVTMWNIPLELSLWLNSHLKTTYHSLLSITLPQEILILTPASLIIHSFQSIFPVSTLFCFLITTILPLTVHSLMFHSPSLYLYH